MFHIIASMEEFERELTKERVKAGLENARRKGKRLGRKPLAPVMVSKVHALRNEGLSYRTIAQRLEVSLGSVHKSLAISGRGSVSFI